MGEAREVMDRLTAAIFTTHDLKAAEQIYSRDAVAATPDAGELRGRDAIGNYLQQFMDAFPDIEYRHVAKHESGNVAIDEGILIGTHTGALVAPNGESVPPTGKRVEMRGCDVVTVENGLVTSHHLYFDQVEFLSQLELLPELPA